MCVFMWYLCVRTLIKDEYMHIPTILSDTKGKNK